MNIVLAQFKARVAEEKAAFKAMSKEEKKALRNHRKEINQYVDKATEEWRVEKEEDRKREKQVIRDSLAEWCDLVIDRWDTRNPPSNIFQMEHVAEMNYSQKKWLHA